MTQTLSNQAAVTDFSSVRIDDQGLGYRYRCAGAGSPILILVDESDVEATRFHTLLAERFAVTLLGTAGKVQSGEDLATVIAALDIGSVALICSGSAAAAGFGCTMSAPTAVSKLILIAPDLREPTSYSTVATPVLVLEGTVDRAGTDDIGQRLAGSLPNCYDILVYDATRSLAYERPEAAASVVADFIERGGGFTVTKPQGPIYP